MSIDKNQDIKFPMVTPEDSKHVICRWFDEYGMQFLLCGMEAPMVAIYRWDGYSISWNERRIYQRGTMLLETK